VVDLIICEFGFNEPDKNPKYSMREVDFYAFIPHSSQREFNVRSHRLSLRKNLETGKFEVYRYYYEDDTEEVAFEGRFEDALEFANREVNKYWGFLGKREPDIPCEHKPPNIDSIFCPKARRRKYG
jgi:hypothetical protein